MKSKIIYTNKMGRGRQGKVAKVQPGDIVTYCIDRYQTSVVAEVFPRTKEILTESLVIDGHKIRDGHTVEFKDVREVRRPFGTKSRKVA